MLYRPILLSAQRSIRTSAATRSFNAATAGVSRLFRPQLPAQQHLKVSTSSQIVRMISNSAAKMNTDAPLTDKMETKAADAETPFEGWSLKALPKSSVFTDTLKPDPEFPTRESVKKASRAKRGPRQVRNAHFSWVLPEGNEPHPEVLCVSESAMKELGIKKGDELTHEFAQIVAGNIVVEEVTPWAMAYGGWQFGQWAGQLGDGRAMTLFELTHPQTKKRYELQLKGAGLTPYSRFADGKAVLRSSIREFVVCEYLHAIGIPSTRALALTLTPSKTAVRERVEPCAIVTRFAPSWIRVGNFDLFRWRGERENIRQLADYVIKECFGGEDNLVPNKPAGADQVGILAPNRYHRMYREIVLRNARVVAKWQCFGFMNGVLNTDNTHIMGLSLDFGPFSFMDNFDPDFTPNHDDYMLRYNYTNQPTTIWWNLVRLAEDIAELIGAGDLVDTPGLVAKGIPEEFMPKAIERIEGFIKDVGEEYKAEFKREYRTTMANRFGFVMSRDEDVDNIIAPTLDMLKTLHLDFNQFFRRLSKVPILRMEKMEEWREAAKTFLQKDNDYNGLGADKAMDTVAEWLAGAYRTRLQIEESEGHGRSDEERMKAMLAYNPNFVPRSWVLQEVIEKVEKQKDREILPGIMKMVLEPYSESWGWNEELEKRYTSDPPAPGRGLQCSCSS